MYGNPCCLTGRRLKNAAGLCSKLLDFLKKVAPWHKCQSDSEERTMVPQEGAGDPDRCQICNVSAEKTKQKAFSPPPAAAFPSIQQLMSTFVPYRKDSTIGRGFKTTDRNSTMWAMYHCIFLTLKLMRGFLTAASLWSVKPHTVPIPYGKSSQMYWIQLSSLLKLEWGKKNGSESLRKSSDRKEVMGFVFP